MKIINPRCQIAVIGCLLAVSNIIWAEDLISAPDSLSCKYFLPANLKSAIVKVRSFNRALRLSRPKSTQESSLLVLSLSTDSDCKLTVVDRFTDGVECYGSIHKTDEDSTTIKFNECKVLRLTEGPTYPEGVNVTLNANSNVLKYELVAKSRSLFESWINKTILQGTYRCGRLGIVSFGSNRLLLIDHTIISYVIRPERNDIGYDIVEFESTFPGTQSTLFAINHQGERLTLLPVETINGAYVIKKRSRPVRLKHD
jgi:hypothetical protein